MALIPTRMTWMEWPRLLMAGVALALAGSVAPSLLWAQSPDPPRTIQPGAPGESSRVLDAGEVRFEFPEHVEADVHFMRMMIAHHGQALEMSSLAPDRAARADVQLLAHRIHTAQLDEIARMEQWLHRRGEEVPDIAFEPTHHAMPGMLSPDELARLADSTGEAFDRLFLEFMILHHEGALLMVRELFASAEGGQEGEIFQFASHVDSDQRIEIERMRAMLTDGS